jgi:hypothetical protein
VFIIPTYRFSAIGSFYLAFIIFDPPLLFVIFLLVLLLSIFILYDVHPALDYPARFNRNRHAIIYDPVPNPMSDANLRLSRSASSSLPSLIFFAVWTSTQTLPTTPAVTTHALSTAKVEQRFPCRPIRHYCSSFARRNSKTQRSCHFPSPSPLVFDSHPLFPPFLRQLWTLNPQRKLRPQTSRNRTARPRVARPPFRKRPVSHRFRPNFQTLLCSTLEKRIGIVC